MFWFLQSSPLSLPQQGAVSLPHRCQNSWKNITSDDHFYIFQVYRMLMEQVKMILLALIWNGWVCFLQEKKNIIIGNCEIERNLLFIVLFLFNILISFFFKSEQVNFNRFNLSFNYILEASFLKSRFYWKNSFLW